MKHQNRLVGTAYMLSVLILLLLLNACNRGQTPDMLPTVVDPESLPTDIAMTQNAPPAGFETVSFPLIDAGLNLLPGWRYEVTLGFDGTFARTPRETEASAQIRVWFNQLASARRVVFETEGELIGQEENVVTEAVQMGPDAFLVLDDICQTNATEAAAAAAGLGAGQLIGGVNHATPTGRSAVLNGVQAWQYQFATEDLNLPTIRLSDGGRLVSSTAGELWVAPEHNVVVRFYVNLEVENAVMFDRQLPVTGQVIIRYDLFDVGVVPNISVPFGC
jgi:hypothetical protein